MVVIVNYVTLVFQDSNLCLLAPCFHESASTATGALCDRMIKDLHQPWRDREAKDLEL